MHFLKTVAPLLLATLLASCGGTFFSFECHVESEQPLTASGTYSVTSSVSEARLQELVLSSLNAALVRRGLTPAPAGGASAAVRVTVSDAPDPTIGLPQVFGRQREAANWLKITVHAADAQPVWTARFCSTELPPESWLDHVKEALPEALEDL